MAQATDAGGRAGQLELPSPAELARLRRELVAQKEMARLLGVDAAQLSRFERGKGSMSYERIRRYANTLNVMLAERQPHAFLVERIAKRGPLVTLRTFDRIEHALEAMVAQSASQLPVQDRDGEPIGVLTEVAVCAAFVDEEIDRLLGTRVGALPIEPLDVVRPGDPLQKVAALLATHWLVRVADAEGDTIGYATRGDLLPMLIGHRLPERRAGRSAP